MTAIAAFAAVLATAGSARAVERSGEQSGVWFAADNPHVITSDVRIPEGEVLQVQRGCIVRFRRNTAMDVEGHLITLGEAQDHVTFRSDDSRPRAGDWEGIRVSATGTTDLQSTVLQHAVVGVTVHGGRFATDKAWILGNLEEGVVLEASSEATLWDSNFGNNGRAGLRIEDNSPLVYGCNFMGNELGVQLSGNAFPSFHDCAALSNSSLDGILVDATNPITADVAAWQGGGMPYVLEDGSELIIESGAQLLMQAGTVLKAGRGAQITVRGVLILDGTDETGCVLSSLNDDWAIGDTNRDGDVTTASKGDWSGIQVEDGGRANLNHAELRHGEDGLRVFMGGDAVLRNCKVHHAQDRGLAFGAGATGLVEDSHLHDNGTGLLVLDPTGLALGRPLGGGDEGGGNTFGCNESFDVQNPSAVMLPARRNYWRGSGAPDPATISGPMDSGDWLPSAPDSALSSSEFRVRPDAGDLLFTWPESSSCALYRLHVASAPNDFFSLLEETGGTESHRASGLAQAEGSDGVTYYKLHTTL